MTSEDEDFYRGSEHGDKIGSRVTLDVDGRAGRTAFTGILHRIQDRFDRLDSDKLLKTTVVIGSKTLVLNWEGDVILSARISVHRPTEREGAAE